MEALEEQPLAPRQEQAEAHGLFLGSGMGRTPLLVGLPCPLVAASVAVHVEHPSTGAWMQLEVAAVVQHAESVVVAELQQLARIQGSLQQLYCHPG